LGASPPSAPRFLRRGALVLIPLLAASLGAGDVRGQVVADPILRGRVLVGGAPMATGTVVLHQINDVIQGEIDSTRVAPDGTFSLRLPGVPNPARGELYFAAVRHAGVLYFGYAVTEAIQLDSLYEIQAYDTLVAPTEGVPVTLEARNIFFEPDGTSWRITDVFQLRNDLDRTVVARPGGRVWAYPLPDVATEVLTGEGELSADVITYEEGSLVVRAALPPGERMFVVRYTLASPEVAIPTPGATGMFDVLVREPAPPLEIDGLTPAESVELEGGSTYRRFAGEDVSTPFLTVALGEEQSPPPVRWIAVGLAAVLAAGGLLAFRGGSRRPKPVRVDARHELIVELARLDEEFQGRTSPSKAAKQEYQSRRAELIRRLKTSS
jgi:hypothetical protein